MKINYVCPKCGGSDYFMSQRNVVSGIGIYQSAKLKSIPVCRVCDEIMTGTRDKEEDKKDAKIFRRRLGILWIVVIIGVLITTLVMYLAGGIESVGPFNSPNWLNIIEEPYEYSE